MSVYDRSVQAMEARLVADDRRVRRAGLLRSMERGHPDAVSIVEAPPPCVAAMFVFDFLFRVPGIGSAAVRDLNRQAVLDGVNLAVSLGELTPGRREWLIRAIQLRQPRLASRPQG